MSDERRQRTIDAMLEEANELATYVTASNAIGYGSMPRFERMDFANGADVARAGM